MSDYINTYKVGDEDKRHWGFYEVTAVGFLPSAEGGWAHCDKVIGLNPGCKLSVQKHFFRREIWEVTKGEIIVSKGDTPATVQEYVVKAGEKIELPEAGIHFVENRSGAEAVFEERQFGPVLDEGDNVRFPTVEDPRETDFDAVARNIALFKEKGFPEKLKGKWSEAYAEYDPSAPELHIAK